VEFPVGLLKRTDQAAAQRSINRSQLIRRAVERLLDRLEHEQLAQELAAGYRANAAIDRQICEEFAHVDAENL
jgi:metal-responsive CopG/Arc/MetJ family transcriptional regulator